ncbi:MAG: glycosyltransferase [Synechococcaceae cyanobacterium ELA263]
MNILFIHQGFPGQYIRVLKALAASRQHKIVGLGRARRDDSLPAEIAYLPYGVQRGNTPGIHPLVMETESKVIRAEACAKTAHRLQEKGFRPDLICAHPGWGEALFIKDIWPQAPLLSYQEFYYQPIGFDSDFDQEMQGLQSWQDKAKLRMKTANLLLNLQASNWCVTPTQFQRSSFPKQWQSRISVIHEGIDTQLACPDAAVAPLLLPDGTSVRRGDPVVTFVNRRLEPYRGCHSFLRALPELQRLAPDARVVIVGQQEGVSYGAECRTGSWKEVFLKEIEGQYDPSRVHFTDTLAYGPFLQLLQISAVHVYLTYPFVLSWSLLEAMSSGCAVVGSDTAPVREVIRDGHNGLLVDFFSRTDLAAAVAELLHDRARAEALGAAARKHVQQHYGLDACLRQQLALMALVASGGLNASD